MNLAFQGQGDPGLGQGDPGKVDTGKVSGAQGDTNSTTNAAYQFRHVSVPVTISALGVMLLLMFVIVSVYKHIKNSQWSRTDIIGVAGVVVMSVGIIVTLLNPEIRRWLGL
jgi:uncharacterized membrane protein